MHVVVTVNFDGAAGGKAKTLMVPGFSRIGLIKTGFEVAVGFGFEPEFEPEVGTVVGATATGGAVGGSISAKESTLPCTVAYIPHSQHVPPVGVLIIQ